MGINKRDEGKKINSNINVTPMVDVMLVLLIIFMVITPMLNNKVNVDLPKADAAVVMEDANKEDAVVVAVTRDGRTFLGGDQVTLDDLGPQDFGEAREQDRAKRSSCAPITRANYGKVMDAVDGIRSAGVSQLGLLTEKRTTRTAARGKEVRRFAERLPHVAAAECLRRFAMGMGGGSTGGAVSDINVTPLIDVLLVLLIIFMVIVPVTPEGSGDAGASAAQGSIKDRAAERPHDCGAGAVEWCGCSVVQDQRNDLQQAAISSRSWRRSSRPARRR